MLEASTGSPTLALLGFAVAASTVVSTITPDSLSRTSRVQLLVWDVYIFVFILVILIIWVGSTRPTGIISPCSPGTSWATGGILYA